MTDTRFPWEEDPQPPPRPPPWQGPERKARPNDMPGFGAEDDGRGIVPSRGSLDLDDLESQLIDYYGIENYKAARVVYNRLRYQYPDKPLTSLDPVIGAKELLDTAKRCCDEAREYGEDYPITAVLTVDDLLQVLADYVNNPTLKNAQLNFGSQSRALRVGLSAAMAVHNKIRDGVDLNNSDRWVAAFYGRSIPFWVFVYPAIVGVFAYWVYDVAYFMWIKPKLLAWGWPYSSRAAFRFALLFLVYGLGGLGTLVAGFQLKDPPAPAAIAIGTVIFALTAWLMGG